MLDATVSMDGDGPRRDYLTSGTEPRVRLLFSPFYRGRKMRPRGAYPGSPKEKGFGSGLLGFWALRVVIVLAAQEACK